MRTEIVLIGPIGAGKTTQGKLLSEFLGVPNYSMDALRWDYYKEIGYCKETEQHIDRTEGDPGVYRYWKPFEAHAVERLLSEHWDCVFDFGGGHSVFEDAVLFDRVRQALAPFRNVILLLPSPDLDESIRILCTRKYNPGPADIDFHTLFVKHHSNHDLAKIVVYTKDKTPEQARDDILAAMLLKPLPADTCAHE